MALTTAIPWKRTETGVIYPLATGQVMWVCFTVPPATDMERWYLEVPDLAVDRATLDTQDSLELLERTTRR